MFSLIAVVWIGNIFFFWAPVHGRETEARKQAALQMSSADRLSVAKDFMHAYGQTHLTAGIVEFTEWLAKSGRLTDDPTGGSRWWRGANGLLILDFIDADRVLRSGTLNTTTPTVQRWVDYVSYANQTGLRNPLKTQRLWWKAHQTSLHHGIHVFEDLLPDEPDREIDFIGHISVPNVDLTALLLVPTNIKLIKLYANSFYPKSYPATRLQLSKAMAVAPAVWALLLGVTPRVANIGLNSTRWDVD